MKGTNEIRAVFLDYFAQKDHEIVASSPLVPDNDPTLMFTNAGMVQFKNVFTGLEKRPYTRATSSQKCVRAGGKHNDLDNVGYTARHHTFFEMLGNFSFGDYFKEEAIVYAWELLTKNYGLNADKLVVTVYHDDDAAFDLWRKVSGLPEEKIIRIATSDNFWSMGEVGPCGPCSEIFYDHGDHIAGGPPGSPDEDGDRFVEIWNLVFMQFDQQEGGARSPLPKPCVDTGMGLERIAAVMQGTHDNYETDLFKKLIEASQDISGVGAKESDDISHRVIADHLRSTSFLMADGVLPSNEGRGYVLRRIMRRAMRHAHMIGSRDPLMHRLVPTLIGEMGQAFPELGRAEALITETLKLEESRFRQTLERGIKLLDEEVSSLGQGGVLAGGVAFKLYDTYGFPLDLTQDALRAKGMTVDEDGFNKAMNKQKADARAAWKGSGSSATEEVWFDAREAHGVTEFVGYNTIRSDGQLVEILSGDKVVESAKAGDKVSLLTNQTPFYGLSGGQTGDRGILISENGARIEVSDTGKALGSLHVHNGKVIEGTIQAGDILDMQVDVDYRNCIRANHSVTHILHAALRKFLGDHVTQKGSLVAADKLRFDISHNKAVTFDEIQTVENEVNRIIRLNSPVETHLMTPDEAIEAGAMALFGEKYGDEVRVVTMGDSAFSVELCGGTHVTRTGDIGYFKIISEGAVASGVRRIEALTGQAALDYTHGQENHLLKAVAELKTSPDQLSERLKSLLEERKSLARDISELQKKLAMGGGGEEKDEIKKIGDISFHGKVLNDIPAKELRGLADAEKSRMGSGVVAFIAVNEGKAAILTAVTDDLVEKVSAVDLVRIAAEAVGGKGGGGRPDMAQAGGPEGGRAQEALEQIEKKLSEL